MVSRELEAGLRLAAGLPRYLRHTLSYQDACDIIARRAQTRSQNFLRLVRRAVFDQSSSPYLPLFKAAQCDYQDVVDGLERENLESFLRRLKDAGVWISFDEYKGRVPITRGNLTHPVAEGSFDNRIAKRGFTATTGGSSGRAIRAMVDLEFLAERAPYDHLMFAMLDLGQVPFALWYPKVPASVALIQCLRYAKIGQTLTEWFDMTLGGDVVPRWQVWGVDAVITASRFFPTRFPRPRKVAIKDPGPIVDWLLAMRARHGRAALQSTVSGVLRVAHLAADRGVRLNGVQFVVGSEPLTAARQCLIEATGARVYSRYHAIDVGTIAQECGHPAEPGDLHLATDTVIALQQEQAENTPSPLYVTQLIDTSPKVLINTEIGDAAILSNRRCGCLWESCGLQTHLTSVRSYRRSTAEGLAISYAELGRIAEEVLPARFGGAALNYQWAEESNEKGVTQLWLRVDPRVGPIEDGQLRQTVLDVLRQLDPAHRFYAQMMDNAEIIRVRREPPRIGSHGKTPAVIRQSL